MKFIYFEICANCGRFESKKINDSIFETKRIDNWFYKLCPDCSKLTFDKKDLLEKTKKLRKKIECQVRKIKFSNFYFRAGELTVYNAYQICLCCSEPFKIDSTSGLNNFYCPKCKPDRSFNSWSNSYKQEFELVKSYQLLLAKSKKIREINLASLTGLITARFNSMEIQ